MFADGPGGLEFSRSAPCILTCRRVMNCLVNLIQRHLRIKVREVVKLACGPNRQPVGRIKRKEPNSGSPIEGHVGTDIQLVKSAGARKGRKKRSAYAPHREGDDTDP